MAGSVVVLQQVAALPKKVGLRPFCGVCPTPWSYACCRCIFLDRALAKLIARLDEKEVGGEACDDPGISTIEFSVYLRSKTHAHTHTATIWIGNNLCFAPIDACELKLKSGLPKTNEIAKFPFNVTLIGGPIDVKLYRIYNHI